MAKLPVAGGGLNLINAVKVMLQALQEINISLSLVLLRGISVSLHIHRHYTLKAK